MAQESTPESAGSAQPFKVPRQARRVHAVGSTQTWWGREGAGDGAESRRGGNSRWVDWHASQPSDCLNRQRPRMLFATVYDGTWDQYIDDFVAKPGTSAA